MYVNRNTSNPHETISSKVTADCPGMGDTLPLTALHVYIPLSLNCRVPMVRVETLKPPLSSSEGTILLSTAILLSLERIVPSDNHSICGKGMPLAVQVKMMCVENSSKLMFPLCAIELVGTESALTLIPVIVGLTIKIDIKPTHCTIV